MNNIETLEEKIYQRNKWTYSVSGIGRDMMYTLVATFLMTYIQFSGLGLTEGQFFAIGVILVIGRIWDGINDPIMGSIVENTKSKFGKFKPWIVIGAILTSVSVLFMFNLRPTGTGFVVFFAIVYFVWEIAWTLNDIPYWSLLPNLSRTKKRRDQIASMVVVFAAVGAFAANAIVSLFTVGNAIMGYRIISITFVLFFLLCTALTVFGVKEPKNINPYEEEKVSLKQMFSSIKNNDQLLWVTLALLLYTVGSGILVALGYNFFYMELGYNGTIVLIFVATFGVVTILVQSFYAKLAKRFTRNQLMTFGVIMTFIGYFLFLIMGYIGFLPIHIITVCIFGAFAFGGQAIIYMTIIINMTNTIEYNEYKTGKRNEAILFSLRPFVVKLASAIQQGIMTLVLILFGIYALSQNVSELEAQKNYFDVIETTVEQDLYKINISLRNVDTINNLDIDQSRKDAIYSALDQVDYIDNDGDEIEEMIINDAADSAFKDKATPEMKLGLRLSITIMPVILIGLAFLVFKTKFIITEEYYDRIVEEIREKLKESDAVEDIV
ncbi:MAG: glycoside-pentoside-hexuronide (GPH):cation symporter [Candidatus Izemoplasmatales bacterium]|jgi:melibiose permease/lactose/raffinose/galactose permease|nr:glycoside-pentoside-hexuronide (GPH):cation symporter [Candidatus Izemoplasmatales bacterium]